MYKFLSSLFAALIATILSGLFFKSIEKSRHLKELIAVLIALKNEFNYNSIHRGIKISPFQLDWLTKALSNPEFYEYCENFSSECLEISELMKDANLGNLNRRKNENGTPLVPADVQEKCQEASNEIQTIIPLLKKQTGLFNIIVKYYKK